MEVVFLKSFLTDIKRVKDQKLKQRIRELIIAFENATSLEDIPNISKMKGYSIAFRVRVGDYRLGFYCEREVVELARFVKRNDIYKVFPE